jgi:AAA family ATPase
MYVPYWYHAEKSNVEIKNFAIPKPATSTNLVTAEFPGLQGLDHQLKQLRQHIDRINHVLDDHYKSEILGQPSAILLHGPSGVGKTAVLDRIEQANWSKVIRIESKKTCPAISKIFADALSAQPSLIILDDLETLAGRESDDNSFAKEMTKQIQKLSGSRVQVIAATTRKFDIDIKLLGSFGDIIDLPIPTKHSRSEMLISLAGSRASKDSLNYVASRTHAFTAKDLKLLCVNAFESAFQRCGSLSNWKSATEASPIQITTEDFEQAMLKVHPSTMAEAYIEVPEVRWSDIAGSTEVKKKLQHAVELPLKHPSLVERLNLRTNSGILMYGPPGCSKTLTAKALATESGLNFIAVQGPSLISKYVGESEQKIRDVFRKAREAAPSVIFFDEIDSIAPNRGSGHEGLNTVATLLNEMDGVEAVKKVLVLAATNRPDAIDPALLRPGRLGATIFVGPPGKEAIESILRMHTDKMHAAEDLALSEIAERMVEDREKCYSGADVAELCHNAGYIRASEAMENGTMGSGGAMENGTMESGSVEGGGATANNKEEVGLRKKDLEAALAQAKPSLSIEAVESLRSWSIAGVNKVN